MFNQQFPTTQTQAPATPSSKSAQNSSQLQLPTKSSSTNHPGPSSTPSLPHHVSNIPNMPSQFMAPPMSYMDPSYQSYMYYQMANPYAFPGMHPFSNPYAMASQGPYGMPMMGSASLAGGQRQLQEDQQSMHSLHFDLDTRSEKKLNLTNRTQSVAAFKVELQEQKRAFLNNKSRNDLLIEAPNQTSQNVDAMSIPEPVNVIPEIIKREEHRMTPQLHQLPHVRATFALSSIVQIRANDPCEGQPALVDIVNLTDFMEQFVNNLKNLKLNNLGDEDNSSYGLEMKTEIL